MKRLFEEAVAMFDGGESCSFNEKYKGKEYLFEDDDIDSIIDPRMKKLFEETYSETHPKRLRERK